MKRIISLLLCLTLLLGAMPLSVSADSEPEDGDRAESWRYTDGLFTGGDAPLLQAEAYHPNATLVGIDVSAWQGQIDWEKVKADGIDFAIIRCGYGMDQVDQDDEYFEYNASECERLGIPYGVYIYSYATTTARASSEADHVLRLISGHTLSYPVYYDMEDASTLSSDLATIATTFCNKIIAAGYPVGVYANLNWWTNYLTDPCFDNWHRWMAQYNSSCSYQGEYAMWQYTSSGSVDGISGRVDMNFQIGYPADHGTNPTCSLTTNKSTYQEGEAILVTAATNVAGAWVAIYGAEEEISPLLPSYYWYYVNGTWSQTGQSWKNGETYNLYSGVCSMRQQNGTIISGALPAGQYRVAVLYGSDYKVLTSKTISITAATDTTVSLATDKLEYRQGESVLVSAVSYKEGAWVGLYSGIRTDDFGEDYLDYFYTSCNNGAAVPMQPTAPGSYTVALFADAGYSQVEEVVFINVSAASGLLLTDKQVYTYGDPILVTANYSAEGAWVGLYKKGENYGESGAKSIFWYYLSEETSPVNILTTRDENGRAGDYGTGEYTIVLFADSGYSALETVDIQVTKAVGSEKTVPATCTEPGYVEITYSDGSVDSYLIPKLGHNYESVATAPTCEEEGFTTNTCSRCGNVTVTAGAPALGHSWDEGTVTKRPTAAENGEMTYTCTVCGDTYTQPIYASDAPTVLRLSGTDRFDTAFKVADELKIRLGVAQFDTILLASGTNFADALGGSYLAAVKNAPILLSYTDVFNLKAADYIRSNLASGGTVYILGGKAAVSESMETMLAGLNVKRLAGADRFETNLLILKEAGVTSGQKMLVCTGSNFADSLSGSATGLPILMVNNASGKLSESQKAYLSGLEADYCIIGGESAVGSSLESALGAYGTVERLAGADRFETSVMVAQTFFGTPASAVLAYAGNFPDGLCGGALAYGMKAPLILTMTHQDARAAAYAKSVGISQGVVLGGDGLISDGAVRWIFSMAAEQAIEVR